MSRSDKPANLRPKPTSKAAVAPEQTNVALVCGLGWLIPGAGHLLQGAYRQAGVFFGVLITMFALGLAFGGRLFPFQLSEPLVFLAAAAQWAIALPRAVASLAGWGQGAVTSATYEYGNTFLIAAGLLNSLILLDAFDIATGRKSR